MFILLCRMTTIKVLIGGTPKSKPCVDETGFGAVTMENDYLCDFFGRFLFGL